jgi:protein-S-isoprenylcysteine O-methyltransferase Ste14
MSEDQRNNLKFRIFALAWSGILVLIIFPGLATWGSLLIDSFFGLPTILPFPINIIIGIIIWIPGFFWSIWANLDLFRQGKGSPVPLKDSETRILVIKGPYKYCRNPMIFGHVLIWVGFGFFFNSYTLLLGFSLLIAIILIIFVKTWEEKDLENRFGDTYRDYKNKISFIFPLPPKSQEKRWY